MAVRLGVSTDCVFAAYEDAVFYYMLRERKLPSNVDVSASKLADPLERARLTRIFDGELGDAAGFVLPLAPVPIDGAPWQSGRWFLRRERCYLIPGDSPIGYRLPLDSLPAVSPVDFPYVWVPAGSRPRTSAYWLLMRNYWPSASRRGSRREGGREVAPGRKSAAPDAAASAPSEHGAAIIRTSMCAEEREGVLYVFMPPTRTLDDYLAIVAAVEASAKALDQALILEGYEPPQDPRLVNFKVTPDPGVIEVNVQPSASWDELAENTAHLYDTAAGCGLRSEKFMVDGRHVGTGGGNHIVMGGATPQDSPFLRRPDVLRSLISYWHNHPSLSYLFSGMFIGPTSQAPRVDEARNDSLYELEIAFKQFPEIGAEVAPWLVDRLLRNLLIDVSGNTHRAGILH